MLIERACFASIGILQRPGPPRQNAVKSCQVIAGSYLNISDPSLPGRGALQGRLPSHEFLLHWLIGSLTNVSTNSSVRVEILMWNSTAMEVVAWSPARDPRPSRELVRVKILASERRFACDNDGTLTIKTSTGNPLLIGKAADGSLVVKRSCGPHRALVSPIGPKLSYGGITGTASRPSRPSEQVLTASGRRCRHGGIEACES